jgi:hypothetical protein
MEVALREDADELAGIEYGKMSDRVLAHHSVRGGQSLVMPDRVGPLGHESLDGGFGHGRHPSKNAANVAGRSIEVPAAQTLRRADTHAGFASRTVKKRADSLARVFQ